MFEKHRHVVDGSLAIRSFPQDGETVVVLTGELDRSNVLSAAEVIEALLGSSEEPVVIDLQELDFLDSSGVALLARLNGEERNRDRLRVVPSRSPGVSRILACTGLDAKLSPATGAGVPAH